MSYAGKVETSSGYSPFGSTLYGVCSTASNNPAKVVSLANFDELLEGVTVHVKFVNSNTPSTPQANPTLKVGDTDAKPIMKYGTTGAPGTTEATSWKANSMVSLTYDGTYWRINDVGAEDAIFETLASRISAETSGRQAAVTAALYNIAAPYSSSATYETGDLVINNDLLYVCTTPITTAEAWTLSHWTLAMVSDSFARKIVAVDQTATFSLQATPDYEDYPYRAAVAIDGVTASMTADVIFSMADATSGVFAPVAVTYDGGVYVYADSEPAGTVTIPTIIVWR